MIEDKAILLAEDNSDDIELIRRLFEKNRIRNKLVVIQDGEEVLEYLFRQGRFKEREYSLASLILLDLKLPKIDGGEVLDRIRSDRRTSSIPILILLSHEGEKDVLKEHGLDVDGFIRKPLDLDEFKKAVENAGFPLIFGSGKKEDL